MAVALYAQVSATQQPTAWGTLFSSELGEYPNVWTFATLTRRAAPRAHQKRKRAAKAARFAASTNA